MSVTFEFQVTLKVPVHARSPQLSNNQPVEYFNEWPLKKKKHKKFVCQTKKNLKDSKTEMSREIKIQTLYSKSCPVFFYHQPFCFFFYLPYFGLLLLFSYFYLISQNYANHVLTLFLFSFSMNPSLLSFDYIKIFALLSCLYYPLFFISIQNVYFIYILILISLWKVGKR